MDNVYLVKDLARLSGLSVYTVKYYLKLGLIKEVSRSPETNFRYFSDSNLEDLKKILAYKRQNMSLRTIQNRLKEGSLS